MEPHSALGIVFLLRKTTTNYSVILEYLVVDANYASMVKQ